ncbi:hypothetical protein L202_07567 [Cryptococcus amylolentus CBS 6039]|uniref:Zn(2)-C6 fungal-type domain-containing protein n=1 Tax=Cryptococcus amylolentus CBS 6039 TaxID=1295533 RepID=A0A1E3HCN9_9TREE|nr:hypothetical protein L202_07567 [Cryptococcus amylolentus CBS 6039]ODN74109.1 hypothetical protein L202_07567 [Cryptococcus amylolentus CBS 6039]
MADPPTFAQQTSVFSVAEGPSTSGVKRGKTGCLTCRLRKKRCDEAKPVCLNCDRLGLECMGYTVKRPDFLKEEEEIKRIKADIKAKMSETRRANNKKGKGKSRRSNRKDSNQTTSTSDDQPVDDPAPASGFHQPATATPSTAMPFRTTPPDSAGLWSSHVGMSNSAWPPDSSMRLPSQINMPARTDSSQSTSTPEYRATDGSGLPEASCSHASAEPPSSIPSSSMRFLTPTSAEATHMPIWNSVSKPTWSPRSAVPPPVPEMHLASHQEVMSDAHQINKARTDSSQSISTFQGEGSSEPPPYYPAPPDSSTSMLFQTAHPSEPGPPPWGSSAAPLPPLSQPEDNSVPVWKIMGPSDPNTTWSSHPPMPMPTQASHLSAPMGEASMPTLDSGLPMSDPANVFGDWTGLDGLPIAAVPWPAAFLADVPAPLPSPHAPAQQQESTIPSGQNSMDMTMFNVQSSIDDFWASFGNPNAPHSLIQTQNHDQNDASAPPWPRPKFNFPIFSPPPRTLSVSTMPSESYIQHYFNVMLPKQYPFIGFAISDFLTRLTCANGDVLTSLSSLAALHISASKRREVGGFDSTMQAARVLGLEDGQTEEEDVDQQVASSGHQHIVERLRFIAPAELTSEAVVVSAITALSYVTFAGGTAPQWRESLAVIRGCLASTLAASSKLGDFSLQADSPNVPWKQYRPLIEFMIRLDIIGSVTENKPSRLLDVYRVLLKRSKADPTTETQRILPHLVGCDNTTLLVIAECAALSHWRTSAENEGRLQVDELVRRGQDIEDIMDDRDEREACLGEADSKLPEGQADKVRAMREAFFCGARVLWATVVNGPFPGVPKISLAVQETITALQNLFNLHGSTDINRVLIFPITLAGAHAETPSQQAFFRNMFSDMSETDKAFGNRWAVLQMMEEVWRKRRSMGKGARVEWREMMKDMGWEAGVLLV